MDIYIKYKKVSNLGKFKNWIQLSDYMLIFLDLI